MSQYNQVTDQLKASQAELQARGQAAAAEIAKLKEEIVQARKDAASGASKMPANAEFAALTDKYHKVERICFGDAHV